MRPRLEASQPPMLWRPAMTRDQAGAVGVLMRRVVTSGTGRPLASLPFACAGKTGTAENPRGAAHAWFIGYAPYDRPRVAVAVIVENGGYGSSAALPVARAVFERAAATGLFGQQGGGPAGPR
jgi:peptidoglycan glycosyltransferase